MEGSGILPEPISRPLPSLLVSSVTCARYKKRIFRVPRFVSYNKAYGILFEAFLHFGAKVDATFSISPEQSGSVRVTATGVPEDDESILHSAAQPAAQLAASKGGLVSLRDLVALWFPRHGERLQVLIDNNIAGNADTSGYWEALMGMSDAELSKEMDGIVGLFPNTYM